MIINGSEVFKELDDVVAADALVPEIYEHLRNEAEQLVDVSTKELELLQSYYSEQLTKLEELAYPANVDGSHISRRYYQLSAIIDCRKQEF